VETSLFVNHPVQYLGREVANRLATRVSRLRGGGPKRIRDLAAAQ
jgi:hypothetical protein